MMQIIIINNKYAAIGATISKIFTDHFFASQKKPAANISSAFSYYTLTVWSVCHYDVGTRHVLFFLHNPWRKEGVY